jgi:leucyl-tRNA synthetase
MAKHTYNPNEIEAKWQTFWAAHGVFRTPADPQTLQAKPKAYVLDMFPYPSGGGLHVGHAKSYTASDVITRVRRMQGYNVLHVMGWDAFGLPAERAAERENTHPAVITRRNIDTFRRQMKRAGFSYDWEREISTASADYYRWTQWIFLKLYENGLAYIADVPVNWCPALGTVLSNEEVQDGKYIETGDMVERRFMRQWMLKITTYAERLLSDLEELEWPEHIKEMQRNWIGKSTGAYVVFAIQETDQSFTVFTTRPDTLFGATYCVLAPEHPLVEQITSDAQRAAIREYVQQVRSLSDLQRTALTKEKSGVFTGAYAVNPVNNQAIPIWIADYVLMSYGTGAIMGVPAHDERDHEFARQFNLPIIEVIGGGAVSVQEAAYVGDGVCVNSGFLDGLAGEQARQKVIAWLEQRGHGSAGVQYRLRDWLFSRQRYWGEPFPIVHLEDGTIATIPEEQLPVQLPELVKDKAVAAGQPPLARAGDDWLMVTLPDGRLGIRETNTMPQWAGSCWYFLRYIDPHNVEEAWDQEAERYWMPVDLYIGGVEHAVLHLLYARFWHKVLCDCGYVSTKEPFQRLFSQGMVLSTSYRDANGKYYYSYQVEEINGQWFVKDTGMPVRTQMEKMSKSRLNGYSLDDAVDAYGADALRLYELSIGPLSASGPWQMSGIEGVYRFLQRVWRLVVDEDSGGPNTRLTDAPASSEPELQRRLHKTIRNVTRGIESLDKMNTAVSQLMMFANAAAQARTLPREIVSEFIRLLSPIAPHICEELWQRLGKTETLAYASWPTFEERLAADEMMSIPVQVNGKLRAVVEVDADAAGQEVEQAALAQEAVQRAIRGTSIKRIINVPGKLVNFVTSE